MITGDALTYASRGVPVFPCRPNKSPWTKNGFKDASTDHERVRTMFQDRPNALIGMPTGEASGAFVLDIDKRLGCDGFATLAQLGIALPQAPMVITPSGGIHVYFRHIPGLKNSAGKIGPGIDTRGEGGYVCVPPSVGYLSQAGDFIGQADLSFPPSWATGGTVLDMEGAAHGIVEAACNEMRAAREGARNHTLNREAFLLTKNPAIWILDPNAVRAALMEAALSTGLPRREIDRTLDSAFQAASAPTSLSPSHQRVSQFYSAASLKGRPVPPREWIVPGLVPNKTVTLFSGDGGTGKSLLALQLAVAVATGRQWIGNALHGGRVMFLSAEDDNDELHRRLDDILRAEVLDYGALAGLTLRSLAGEDALLATDTKLNLVKSELFRELDARLAQDIPSLVIIDTLADAYPANENDRAKVRQFVSFLRGLALSHDCAVMVLSHPSLTGITSGTGTSGSTAWNNSVRSRLYLSRISNDGYEPDPDARVLSTKKANYGRVGGETLLQWRDGVFTVLAPQDVAPASAKAERVFLALLDDFTSQGRRVSVNPGPTYAPALFAKMKEAEGCTKQALTDAMNALLQRGDIVSVLHETRGKSGTHIERKREGELWS